MRLARLVGAVVVLAAGLGAVGGGARVAAAATTVPGVTLVAQSTFVRTGHDFLVRLAVPDAERGRGQLSFQLWPMLITRTAFDAAALGHPEGSAVWSDTLDLDAQGDRGAVVSVRIPVGVAPTGHQLQEFEPASDSGVYPLSVQLDAAGGSPVGSALATFLVDDAGGTDATPLATSVTVPVPTVLSDPLGLPSAAAVAALGQRVAAIESVGSVPVTLSVLPRTLASLALTAQGRAVLAGVRSLAAGGDEFLPGPWTNVNLASMLGAGLEGEVSAQLDEGASALATALGRPVDPTTWEGGDLDAATLATLRDRGLRRLVVPSSSVVALPAAAAGTTTYGHWTQLAQPSGSSPVEVVGADAALSARAAQTTGPVLAAEQTLAELAMVHFEAPNTSMRGVALLPPTSPVPDRYYEVLLAGLRDNPYVQPVTAQQLFDHIPPVTPHRQALSPVAVPTLEGAASIATLSRESSAIAGVVPEDHALLAELAASVLLAPTANLSAAGRDALLSHAFGLIGSIERAVVLPGSTSVTLTSLKANVPLTIMSTSRRALHVDLILDSPKLAFRHYAPGSGATCQSNNRGHESCLLVLDKRLTTLRVPVEARTSGVFTLTVSLRSPDGSLRLAGTRDTIRSAAVSFVGLVIIVLAVVFLAVWWLRDIRSGRRARMLVERPGDDGDDPPDDGGTGPDERGAPPGGHGSDRPVGERVPERVPVSAG